MQVETDRSDIVRVLERDPLRHMVLLKLLGAFPDHARLHHVTDGAGACTLLLHDVAVSAYDRETYPDASLIALIVSDHPRLTERALDLVPPGCGVVFKLASEADRVVVARRFRLEPAACFLSYTADAAYRRDPAVRMTCAPGDQVLDMFAAQGHARDWMVPLLAAGKAFACVAAADGMDAAACLGFETHAPVWEVGGVFTQPGFRKRGLARRAVSTALAVLRERGLVPRYQVRQENIASIALAESLGLRRFLTLAHHLHRLSDGPI